MSNNYNRMIVFASILGAILATALLALNPSPTIITNAGAQMYGDHQYGYNSNYYHDDNKYSYDNNHQKKSSHTDIQKIKCVNSNINVNGVDITQIPEDGTGVAAANTQNGNELADRINFERNLVNVCVNVNDNEQTKVTPPDEEPQPATCEDCFLTTDQGGPLTPFLLEGLNNYLATFQVNVGGPMTKIVGNVQGLCAEINLPTTATTEEQIRIILGAAWSDVLNAPIDEVVECLIEAGSITESP